MIEAPNGWGKTTFFRAISRRTDRRVSLPAKLDAVPGPLGALTVRFLPVFGSGIHQVRVRALLRLVGSRMFPEIAHLADRRVGTLSGGELKRIELVATLGLGSKHLFLLDEPTNALDQKGIEFSTTLMQVSSEHGIVVAAEPYIRGG
jgi:ABC-type Mn2+/Zn2+ transport system ATPase subunit